MMKCGIRDKGGDFWIKEKQVHLQLYDVEHKDRHRVEHRDGLGIRGILLLRISFSTVIEDLQTTLCL